MVFGYTTDLTDGPAQKFTGKERDTESRLDYFGARYFSGAGGRFTSADAPFADQHVENPQSWNLYVYSRNNPLRFIDPTGRCVQEDSLPADGTAGHVCRDASELTVTPETVASIREAEDLRFDVYGDTGEVLTVGWGHRVISNDKLEEGQIITIEQAEELFETDLREAEKTVRNLVGSKTQLSQPEFDALVDLAFNVGAGTLSKKKSPRLNRAIASEDNDLKYFAMSNELRYTKDAKGVQQGGLIKRSAARKRKFTQGTPPSVRKRYWK